MSFFRASPAYNPYYYGYAPYPAYAQAQQYPYAYVQNDGAEAGTGSGAGAGAGAGVQGWAEYLSNSFWSYVPTYGTQPAAETGESAAATPDTQTCKTIKYRYKQNTKFNITLYMFCIRSRRRSDKG